jgi:hypothetical protein
MKFFGFKYNFDLINTKMEMEVPMFKNWRNYSIYQIRRRISNFLPNAAKLRHS